MPHQLVLEIGSGCRGHTKGSFRLGGHSADPVQPLWLRPAAAEVFLEPAVALDTGLAVASALVDVSQQMCVGYKEKSGGLRSRKQPPSAQPSTCI
ncbi:Attractin DPPT-L [Takifugu flavidus]|uniref:Attractin DPPT-L n=1 Tax=Takifugu flavidus TaxID=433684 RepID=A0A5C6P071_9TELE|nr:Attractin DPPT-L [Takifugu flavidus]